MKESPYTWLDSQINIKSIVLGLFSAFYILWHICLVRNSVSLSVFERNPIPINGGMIAVAIIGGYLLSFAAIGLLPKFTGWMERLLLPVAFAANLLMLFPLAEDILAALFYVSIFICIFSFTVAASLACHLFTVAANWKAGIIGTVICGAVIPRLQNDFYGFTVLLFLSLVLLAMLTAFFWMLPPTAAVPFAKKRDRVKLPSIVFVGILLIVALSNLLLGLSLSFAAGANHGISALYLPAAVFAIVVRFLHKEFGSRSIKVYAACFFIIIAGLMLTYFAQTTSHLYLVACVLLSFTVILSNLWIFFMATAFSMYPTRFIAVIGSVIVTAVHLLHFCLISFVGGDSILFSIVYMAAALFLALLYIYLEPYFTYAWESKTLGSNIKLVGQPFSLPHKVQSSRNPHAFDVLSDKELMVVKLLLEGHTKRSIAKNMCIELETVNSHCFSLYSKLEVKSKRDLFRMVSHSPYEF